MLIAGYDALVATFPVFSRCSRNRFLATISSFWSSWSRSTRPGVPDPPELECTPAPTDDEGQSSRGDGSTDLGLESGAADLQAQVRGESAVEYDGRTDNLEPLQSLSGAGPTVLQSSGGTSEPEVSQVLPLSTR